MMKIYPRLQLDISFGQLWQTIIAPDSSRARIELEREIEAFWQSDREVLVTLSVRTAFDLLLQSLCLSAGSEILMSAVNIAHMVEIVERHHCIPKFVDIDIDTLAPPLDRVKSAISDRTKVIVIAHLYGAIVPIEPYVELCRDRRILLVEDCAQAFVGKSYLGHPAADVSLFSFGAIKSLTALGGAVTLVRDANIAAKMRSIENSYPQKTNAWFWHRSVKYLCLKTLSMPKIFGTIVAILQLSKRDPDLFINSLVRGFSQGDILPKLRYRSPDRLLNLLVDRLQSLDDRYFDRRANCARQFLSLLPPTVTIPGSKIDRHSYWLVPILTDDPERTIDRLRAAGFDPTRGATSLRAWGIESVQARKLLERVVYIPAYPGLPKTELIRLAGEFFNL